MSIQEELEKFQDLLDQLEEEEDLKKKKIIVEDCSSLNNIVYQKLTLNVTNAVKKKYLTQKNRFEKLVSAYSQESSLSQLIDYAKQLNEILNEMKNNATLEQKKEIGKQGVSILSDASTLIEQLEKINQEFKVKKLILDVKNIIIQFEDEYCLCCGPDTPKTLVSKSWSSFNDDFTAFQLIQESPQQPTKKSIAYNSILSNNAVNHRHDVVEVKKKASSWSNMTKFFRRVFFQCTNANQNH